MSADTPQPTGDRLLGLFHSERGFLGVFDRVTPEALAWFGFGPGRDDEQDPSENADDPEEMDS